MTIKFEKINNSIIKCKKCPRLIRFSKKISKEKRKKNINEIIWSLFTVYDHPVNPSLTCMFALIKKEEY